MGPIDEAEIVGVIRQILRKKRIKLRALAAELDIPYGTLQNYVYGRSRMPLSIYLEICLRAGVPADYPIHQRIKLNHHALQHALMDVLRPVLPMIAFSDELVMQVVPDQAADQRRTRRNAGILSTLIEGEYDTLVEFEFMSTEDD